MNFHFSTFGGLVIIHRALFLVHFIKSFYSSSLPSKEFKVLLYHFSEKWHQIIHGWLVIFHRSYTEIDGNHPFGLPLSLENLDKRSLSSRNQQRSIHNCVVEFTVFSNLKRRVEMREKNRVEREKNEWKTIYFSLVLTMFPRQKPENK